MILIRKHLLLFFLAISIFGAVGAQQIKVVDVGSEEPLGFVLISQLGSTSYVMTDEEGLADLSLLDKSNPCVLYLLGYRTDTLN